MAESNRIAAIQESIEPAYGQLAEYKATPQDLASWGWYDLVEKEKAEPWRYAICDRWSVHALPLAKAAFTEMGLSSPQIIAADADAGTSKKLGLSLRQHHQYLVDDFYADDPLIMDGTWQQFANPAKVGDAPRILIAHASETADILESAGVDPNLHYLWRPDGRYWNPADGNKVHGVFHSVINRFSGDPL